jgi:hypothetical protein
VRSLFTGALALALLVPGCGGDDDSGGAGQTRLVWDGNPVVRSSTTGARVLSGKVRNDSGRELRIIAPKVAVLDTRDRRLRSTAIFVSGFVRSNYPHNRGPGSEPASYPEAEQERVGYLAVLDDGDSTPLTVSWSERPGGRRAVRIVYGAASLAIPRRPSS